MKNNLNLNFDFYVTDCNVIVIIDLRQFGKKSVTNNIENVLLEIKKEIPDLHKYKIIYRNSNLYYDGIRTDNKGNFYKFYYINTTSIVEALKIAHKENHCK